MKYIIMVLFLLIFSGCTLIGFVVGASKSYQIEPVEELEPGDKVKIYVNGETAQKGKFVFFESDTIQLEVDSRPWLNITDTLAFSMDSIQHVEKFYWWPPWVGASIGFAIDYVAFTSMRNSFGPKLYQ